MSFAYHLPTQDVVYTLNQGPRTDGATLARTHKSDDRQVWERPLVILRPAAHLGSFCVPVVQPWALDDRSCSWR